MGIKYKKLVKKPLIFLRLTGLRVEEFKKVVSKIHPIWELKVNNKKKIPGRPRAMESFEDQILNLFIYYRTYITH